MTNLRQQNQDKERILKLAEEGDLEALQILQDYLVRDPYDKRAQKASLDGWAEAECRFLAMKSSMADFRPSKVHRVLGYLEKLFFDPPEVHIQSKIDWMQKNQTEDWVEYGVPRQTGRTTLMLLDILAEVESGMLEGHVITIISENGGASREIWKTLKDFSQRLGLRDLFRADQFQLYTSQSRSSLRYKGRYSTWVDNTVYDLAKLPHIKPQGATERWLEPLSEEERSKEPQRKPALTVESYDLSQFPL